MDIPDNGIDTSPAALIRYVQQRRMELLLTGEIVDEATSILLAGVAKTALDQTRIMVESGSVKAQREIAQTIARLVNNTPKNPFAAASGDQECKAPEVKLPDMEIPEEEMSTDISTLTYDDYT